MTLNPCEPDAAAPAIPVQRFKLTIAYDGSQFHGWQKQHPPGCSPLRTVAGVVEDVLVRTLRQPINLVGASRTDAGVHAAGQVAQFDAASRIPVERLAQAITSRLPNDVEIVHAQVVPATFDAISQAVTKQYRYRVWHSARRPLGVRHMVYHCPHPLNLELMRDAARRLVGTHDIAGLSNAGHGRQCTVRTIHHCGIETADPEVHIVVQGNGFLYNTVRIIAGTLVEVGRGRMPPDVVDAVLGTQNRRLAGPTLIPNGLCLEWIRY